MKSDAVKKGIQQAPHRSLFNALGLTKEEMDKPLIGIVNSYNEIVPGHMNLDKITEAVKLGVAMAGGVPRVFPAIAVDKSGTRREDLLLTMRERKAVDIMRRRMNGLKAEDAVETIIDEFTRLPTNEMVVDQILAKWK